MTVSGAVAKSGAGRVALIGCGPGAADLLTLRAAEAIRTADVLVVDRLVGDEILALARNDARIVFAGKEAGGPSTPQDEINRILVREALKGQRVARLKGGDGFVFGRAAEEIAAVRAAAIEVEIVPGITAAHACAASIALPLTLRDSVRQFSLVTGSTADGVLDLDWQALSRPGHAFAIYMGVRSARVFRQKLLAAGAPAELAMVVVENGTRETERAVAATLSTLVDAIAAFGITGPAIIFGGLSWQEACLSMPDKVNLYSAREVREGESAPAAPGRDAH